MTILGGIFAIFQAIPIVDRWAERGLASYKKWKQEQGQKQVDQDIADAKNGDTGGLNDDLGANS